MRRGILVVGLVGLCALLAACGGGVSSTGGTGGPTATTPPASPTPNILTLNANDTSATVSSVCGGVFGGTGSQQIVYQLSDSLYAEAVYGLPYASYQLQGNLPVAPYKLPGEPDTSQLVQWFGGVANVNPNIDQGSGILLTVCNASAAPLTLSGARVIVADFTPATGAVNTWNLCDGFYNSSNGQSSGGCGGAIIAEENLSVSFAANDGKYATADGIQGAVGVGASPLPVTLKPNTTLMMLISVTRPTALGTYTFAVAVSTSAAGGATQLSPYAPLPPQLFAQVSHKFSGNACGASAMQSLLPAKSATPTTYYICPQ